MYQKAVELAQANGWFLAHQFETEANAEIHEATTAREILGDFKDERLTISSPGTAPEAPWSASRASSAANGRK